MRQVHLEAPFQMGEMRQLSGESFHHLVRVSRVREGDGLRLAAVNGHLAEGSVTQLERDALWLRVERLLPPEPASDSLVLGLCSPKGDAFETALDMAAQVGFSAIQPLRSARSPVPDDWVNSARLERWRKILAEACDQSLRARLPELREPLNLHAFLERSSGGRWLADPHAVKPLAGFDAAAWQGTQHVLVGPEGGFEESELQLAQSKGWQSINLGLGVLRTPVAVAALGFWIQQRRIK